MDPFYIFTQALPPVPVKVPCVREHIEWIKNVLVQITCPGLKYEDALMESGSPTLHERWNKACEKFCLSNLKYFLDVSFMSKHVKRITCIFRMTAKFREPIEFTEDDFEIKSKIYSLNLRLVLNHILYSQDVFRNLFFTLQTNVNGKKILFYSK